MATASPTSDDFLSGQGVPVDLHEVESELARLWGPAAEQAGGPEVQNPNVTRIALANLVVFGCVGESSRLQSSLETVTARHPSRTIVLRRTDDRERAIHAEVSALCQLPVPGLPQVCSERIVLRAGPNAIDLLPGAVRPLLEAELPFVLWWTSDPREYDALFRDLAGGCSRLILDLSDPAADSRAVKHGLDPTVCSHARDASWFGLTRWRELVAQLFDPQCHHETLTRLDSIKIDVVSPSSNAPPRLAVWLAAWFAGQLGWSPLGAPSRTGADVAATFQSAGGEVAVSIRTRVDPSLPFAELEATVLTTRSSGDRRAERFQLVRVSPQSPTVHVEIDSNLYCTLPRTVLAPELDPAHRVSAALESSRRDPPFEKALPHALWLMGV
jgi:glucose-6-phosphate dehydrogenase assembly protein OpcA